MSSLQSFRNLSPIAEKIRQLQDQYKQNKISFEDAEDELADTVKEYAAAAKLPPEFNYFLKCDAGVVLLHFCLFRYFVFKQSDGSLFSCWIKKCFLRLLFNFRW